MNPTALIFAELFERYPMLNCIKNDLDTAFNTLVRMFSNEGKLLVCGNGGSAADSQHIVGELMKAYKKYRPVNSAFVDNSLKTLDKKTSSLLCEGLEGALPAISLVGENSLTTAFANDRNAELIFAQQVYGLGRKGDTLLAISTSGNSRNVVLAAQTAKAKAMTVVALTGANESKLSSISDVCVCAPATEPYKVQELHLPIYHALCAALEEEFFA